MRQRIKDYDADAGVRDMLNDYHEAHFDEGRREEEPEPTTKAYVVCGTATPSRACQGFSTGCHCTPNDCKVPI